MRRHGPDIDTTVDAARLGARATKTKAICVVVVFVCWLGGCRHAPLAYSLKQEGRTQILTPPASKPEIKNARTHPSQKTGCDIEGASFSVAWHGNTARVAVKGDTYYAPPPASAGQTQGTPGGNISESGPRIYADTMAQFEQFREALSARQDAGCFRDDEGARLRRAITETFPFPPQIATYIRFGAYSRTGFFDLTPEFVLRLVSPHGGSDPDVSFYAVTAVPRDDRVRITFVSGAVQPLTIPDQPAYYRYLYRTGGAVPFLATILGAQERQTLQDATLQFLADPTTFCAKPTPGIFCQSVSLGMNAGFNIRINGSDAFVRLGGSLGEALGEARNGMRLIGPRQPPPQNVTARRMFRGKLIPINVEGAANSILGLVAMPGDEITAGQ